MGPELTALHEQYQAFLTASAKRTSQSARQFQTADRSLQIKQDMVVIDTAADGNVALLEAALEKLGAVDIVAFQRVVSARLPLGAIPALADIEWLRFARPARLFQHVGATTSQGDPAMRTPAARASYGVTGSGVTVGVLSDTFDCGGASPGDYATDMETGDLPAGIEVLADGVCGTDEGRAMLQLIYDVAPGAELSFHTAFGGQAAFALGIEELAGCPFGSEVGCTAAVDRAEVIVDDVGYLAEPMFQDGIIAQAIDVAYGSAVPYFSSAGNSARASWEHSFAPSGIVPPSYGSGNAHDFDPGGGVDIFQKISLPSGVTVISFQWDQPFFSVSGAPGSANDIDVCLYTEPPGVTPVGCALASNVGADPVEVLSITNPGAAVTANLVVVKWLPGGGPDPGLMKYVAFRSDFSVVDPYPTTLAGASFGHNNAMGAVGVGAAFYDSTPAYGTDPALLESFSSAGGTPILFDTAGTRLAMPVVRERPQIVAPDGANTTFFGSDIADPGDGSDLDAFPNFFGTSAAAPHAAAVAALMRQAFPGLLPNGVEDVMKSSASGQNMLTPGFDFDTGYGLIDGNTAVGSVHNSTSCDGVKDLVLIGTPNSAAGTLSATTSITYGYGTFNKITAYAPRHILGPGTAISDTASFKTCP